MSKININNKSYQFSGGSIEVVNGIVKINGKVVTDETATEPIRVIIEEGIVASIKADGDVVANDVKGNVEAGGSVACGNVGGYIDCGGSVNANDVKGNIDCGGSCQCGNVGGDVDAGGSVIHG